MTSTGKATYIVKRIADDTQHSPHVAVRLEADGGNDPNEFRESIVIRTNEMDLLSVIGRYGAKVTITFEVDD